MPRVMRIMRKAWKFCACLIIVTYIWIIFRGGDSFLVSHQKRNDMQTTMDTETRHRDGDISNNRPNAWRPYVEFPDTLGTHSQKTEIESKLSSLKIGNMNRTAENISPIKTAQAVQRLCKDNSNLHSTFFSTSKLSHFILSRKHNFAVCYVPKSGSTFWKKVLYLLNQNNSESLSITDFESVSKFDIHSSPDIPWLFKLYPAFPQALRFLRNASKSMFVRHPYARIFSAYIDKIFLSSFWKTVAVFIIKKFRLNHTARSLECGYDVTFTEFLRYVIHVNQDNMNYFPGCDDHWYAISTLCDPCQMNFDFIGYVERFSEDVRFISKRLNISRFTYNLARSNATDSALEYFSDRMEHEFLHMPATEIERCLSEQDIFHRIWKAFQMHGYISGDAEFRPDMFKSLENISSRIIRFRERFIQEISKTNSSTRRVQKTEALARAYRDVPVHVKQDLKDVFKRDFILFGYNEHPAYF